MNALMTHSQMMIHSLPTLLLGFLIKSTLLLLAVGAAGCLLRRASAATRHLVWSAALGGVLLVPLLSLSLPQWRVAWGHVSVSAPPAPMPVPQAPPLPLAPTVSEAAPPSAPISNELDTPPAITAVSRPIPAPTSGHQFPTVTYALGIGLFAWLIGLLSVLCQLFVGLSRLARIERRSLPLEHGELRLAEDVRGRMGLRRPVRFLRATEANTIAVPVTWGVFRPVVLLPAQSSAWSGDCLRAALLHELAHVQRWDWPTQLMGRLACALYWWHPLVWVAARQAREESERACDDLVLGMGMKAADYAQRLVEVVRSMPVGASPRTVAIAMAQPSEVEGRVQAVLAKGQDRRAPSRRHVLGVMLALALGLGPVAALHLSPSARAAGGTERKLIGPMPATTQVPLANASDSWVTLPNAVTVRLLGVKDSQARTSGWWRPDGTPVIKPISKSTLVFPSLPAGVQGRTFAVETSFQVKGQPKAVWAGKPSGNWNHARSVGDAHTDLVGPRLTWEFDPDDGIRSLNHYLQEQTGTAGSRSLLSQMALAVRPSDRTLTLKWGVAAGPWTQTVSCPKRFGKTSVRTSSGDVIVTLLPTYHQPALKGTRSSAVFTITDHFYSPSPRVMANMWGNYDRVVLALDRWGRVVTQVRGTMEYTPHSAVDDSLIDETMQTATIPNSVLAHVASFRLLARPYKWTEFRGVQLQPGPPQKSGQGIMQDQTPMPLTAGTAERLGQTRALRAHLQSWAAVNRVSLQRMGSALPDDLVSLMRVYDSLQRLPFPLWDGDPRIARGGSRLPLSTLTHGLTLAHLQRSQGWVPRRICEDFAKYHDLRLAESVGSGRQQVILWASGRITRTTVRDQLMERGKVISTEETEQEIVPTFFGGGTRGKAEDTTSVAIGQQLQRKGQRFSSIPTARIVASEVPTPSVPSRRPILADAAKSLPAQATTPAGAPSVADYNVVAKPSQPHPTPVGIDTGITAAQEQLRRVTVGYQNGANSRSDLSEATIVLAETRLRSAAARDEFTGLGPDLKVLVTQRQELLDEAQTRSRAGATGASDVKKAEESLAQARVREDLYAVLTARTSLLFEVSVRYKNGADTVQQMDKATFALQNAKQAFVGSGSD